MTTYNSKVHPAAALFPMIPDDELQLLADDIAATGLHHPVVLAADGTLVDGRNRLAACKLAGVDPTFTTYAGDDVLAFIVGENIRRRHLTNGQRSMLGYDLLPMIEAAAKERMAAAGASSAPGVPAEKGLADRPDLSSAKSRDQAAKMVGTSGRSVGRAKRVATVPELADKVRSGELALDRAERVVRDRESANKRQVEALNTKRQREDGTNVDIRHGDFRDVLADLENVNAIITDPPYPGEYLPLLSDLAAWADKVLADDGVLVVLFGQTYLPEVYRRLDGHRPYRWTGAYMTPGHGYSSMARKLQSNWKPVLVYGGGPRFSDVFKSEGDNSNAKQLHHWGQDYGAFHQIVERLSKAGDLVVDPFMGSGTTLAAAKALGRHAVGCDIDQDHVEATRARLA